MLTKYIYFISATTPGVIIHQELHGVITSLGNLPTCVMIFPIEE